MEADIRIKLIQLMTITLGPSGDEISDWLQEKIAENITKLLNDNSSNRKVADKLVGGLRAISDVLSIDDNPIVIQMISIINEVE